MTAEPSPIAAAPTTAIVIVMFGGWRLTEGCLESIQQRLNGRWRIVLVDNASPDSAAASAWDWARTSFAAPDRQQLEAPFPVARGPLPPFTLIRSSANLGFAGGNNLGIELALGDPACSHVWLLNNDTTVEPQSLDALLAALTASPESGAAGSALVEMDKPGRLQTLGGGHYRPWIARTRDHLAGTSLETAPQAPVTLDFLCGASLLIPAPVVRATGPLDADLFLYVEDVDYSLKLRWAGYRLIAAAKSVVHHKVNATTGTGSMLADYYATRNHVVVAARCGWWNLPTALAAIVGGVLLPKVLRRQWRRLGAAARGLRDGLRWSVAGTPPLPPKGLPSGNARA